MRIFIAVDIDEPVRRRIGEIQRELVEATGLRKGPVKWVRPEQIHLTLKFLGEVADNAIRDVCRIAEETARRHGPFDLEVRGLGTFGRPARVLWAGMQVIDDLAALQQDLESLLEAAGWKRENRAFAAHLTLCRIKNSYAGRRLAEAIGQYESTFIGPVSVDDIVVYESQLTSAGPVYTAVCRSKLNRQQTL